MVDAGANRLAEAVLHACGGGPVRLRMAVPAVGGDDAEQLGLATPGFQDVVLTPAVLRRNASNTKLLITASAVIAAVGSLGYDSADVLFTTAVGVMLDDDLYQITSCVAMTSESQMQQLMGIGQPGRLNQLEARVESHEQSVQRLKGLGAAFGALLTAVHVVLAYFRK